MASDHDAVLLVSFGGPEEPGDVIPFMRRVTAGRDTPLERLEEVSGHYRLFGGRSPINDQNRALKAELEALLAEEGPRLPVYWGNRAWHPLLPDTLRQMHADGIRRALCFVTAAYSSYSGCRQYREELARARAEIGEHAPMLEKLRVFYNHPGFIEPQVDFVVDALGALPERARATADIVFTTHSIPSTMARHCDYEAQHHEACRLVMREFPGRNWDLVYNSRSGPESVPWLEPDINDHLETLAARGATGVVVVPIGFVSDHMEVIYDLDVEAKATAERLALPFARAATVGTEERFVRMIRELVLEQMEGTSPRALGTSTSAARPCPPDCCLTPRQEERPAVPSASLDGVATVPTLP